MTGVRGSGKAGPSHKERRNHAKKERKPTSTDVWEHHELQADRLDRKWDEHERAVGARKRKAQEVARQRKKEGLEPLRGIEQQGMQDQIMNCIYAIMTISALDYVVIREKAGEDVAYLTTPTSVKLWRTALLMLIVGVLLWRLNAKYMWSGSTSPSGNTTIGRLGQLIVEQGREWQGLDTKT